MVPVRMVSAQARHEQSSQCGPAAAVTPSPANRPTRRHGDATSRSRPGPQAEATEVRAGLGDHRRRDPDRLPVRIANWLDDHCRLRRRCGRRRRGSHGRRAAAVAERP
ncbi:MAG: hypothetical protein WKF75_02090 [Singulisphaera sp.]